MLALDRDPLMSRDALAKTLSYIAERQIERLRVVGSNDVTTPVIEASYRRLLALLDSHLVAGHRFLMGARPGAGDFGLFGQLSQLAHFDPTPAAIAAAETPRIVSWVSHLDDPSSLKVDDSGWLRREDAAAVLRPFLTEVGRVYAPFLLANARALASGASEVRCEIDGLPWVQQPFPYQGKCLKWLREARGALSLSPIANSWTARLHRLVPTRFSPHPSECLSPYLSLAVAALRLHKWSGTASLRSSGLSTEILDPCLI